MLTEHSRKVAVLGAVLLLITLTLTACTTPTQTPAATVETAKAAATVATEQPVASATPTTQAMGEYQVITAEQAKKIMDTETNITIVDVREPSEYATGHIKNAKLLPVGDIAKLAATELPDKSAKILVYCRSGRRSRAAAEALISLGYTNVIDFGGITSWPYEVVTQ